MTIKKIRMLDCLRIPGHGVKDTGVVWNAPKDLGEQLCRQGKAESVDSNKKVRQTIDKKEQGDRK